jgi:hypothetical protein
MIGTIEFDAVPSTAHLSAVGLAAMGALAKRFRYPR